MTDPSGYAVNCQPLAGTLQVLDVQRLIDTVTEEWYNQTLFEVSGVAIRLGVLHGEYHWHKHDEQDEFFFVLDGMIRIQLDGRDTVELHARQAYVVPKGLLHRPTAPERSTVLMIERADVIATGD
jgi:mannose-6-phosphate isomerase-like protein (cupin superfamily)